MNLKKILALVFLSSLLFTACRNPVPPEKANYVGGWESSNMILLITSAGRVACHRRDASGKSKISGPVKFEGDNFVVGIGPFKTTFNVTKPPYIEAGQWKMKIDGSELIKMK